MRRQEQGMVLATADSILKAQGVLWIACLNCDRDTKPDLAAIVARGLGDVPVIHLKFRCIACGGRKVHPRLSSPTAERYRREGHLP